MSGKLFPLGWSGEEVKVREVVFDREVAFSEEPGGKFGAWYEQHLHLWRATLDEVPERILGERPAELQRVFELA